MNKFEKGKIYTATYKDYKESEIMFKVNEVTDAGFKTKRYVETVDNVYLDFKYGGRKLNTHRLHYLGLLDIAKLKNVEEV